MSNNIDYIERDKPRPRVLKYYTVYCVMMGLMYLAVFALGFCILVIDPRAFGINDEQALRELGALKIQGVMMTVLGAILSIPYLAAPFLPKKREFSVKVLEIKSISSKEKELRMIRKKLKNLLVTKKSFLS